MGSVPHNTQKSSSVQDFVMITIWSLSVCGAIYYLDYKYQIGKTLEINSQDITMITVGVVFFCVLWVFLEKVFFVPYIKLVEIREQATVGADDIASTKMEEARKLNDQYEARIFETRAAGLRLKNNLQSEAKREATSIIEKAQAEGEKILSVAKAEIENRARELAASSDREAENLANMVIERILGNQKEMH